MARSPSITQNDVTRAAIRLLTKGENPSAAKVRRELGDRGSLTTINNGLQVWRETLQDVDLDVLPPAMPKELAAPVEDFFNTCMGLAERALADHKVQIDEGMRRADEAAAQAREKQGEAESYAAMLDVKLEAQEVRIRAIKDQLDESQHNCRLARVEANEQSDLVKQVLESKDKEKIAADLNVQALQKEFRRERNEFTREKDALLQRIAFAEAKAKTEAERSDSQHNYWIMEVDRERQININQDLKHAKKVERLEQEFFLLSKRYDVAVQKNSVMEQRIFDTEDSLASVEKNLNDAIAREEKLILNAANKKRIYGELAEVNSGLRERIKSLEDMQTNDNCQDKGET